MIECKRCICNSDKVPNMTLDENGICNYCHQWDEVDKQYPTKKEGAKILEKLVSKIKKEQKGKQYDVVVGISGGCDSSYLLYFTKEILGLRPLAAHFNNGWNTEIAERNMKVLVESLDVDYWEYTIDEKEYNSIYKAFLDAGLPDLEASTDIGLTTVLYKAAERFGTKYIFNGHSFRTEGMAPLEWAYMDGRYIKDVCERWNALPLKTFPNLLLKDWLRWLLIKKIERIRPLYYIDYHKEEVKSFLNWKFGWKWYGGHHMESIITLFFANFFRPVRLGIDGRYIEYSALIRAGQMTREEALTLVKKPVTVPEEVLQTIDEKIGYNPFIYEDITMPTGRREDYKSYKTIFRNTKPFWWLMMKTNKIPRSFYIKYCR